MKYGYNEFGKMVPWASLYTKFTVYIILVTRPLQWFYTVTLTLDLLQGQIHMYRISGNFDAMENLALLTNDKNMPN